MISKLKEVIGLVGGARLAAQATAHSATGAAATAATAVAEAQAASAAATATLTEIMATVGATAEMVAAEGAAASAAAAAATAATAATASAATAAAVSTALLYLAAALGVLLIGLAAGQALGSLCHYVEKGASWLWDKVFASASRGQSPLGIAGVSDAESIIEGVLAALQEQNDTLASLSLAEIRDNRRSSPLTSAAYDFAISNVLTLMHVVQAMAHTPEMANVPDQQWNELTSSILPADCAKQAETHRQLSDQLRAAQLSADLTVSSAAFARRLEEMGSAALPQEERSLLRMTFTSCGVAPTEDIDERMMIAVQEDFALSGADDRPVPLVDWLESFSTQWQQLLDYAWSSALTTVTTED